MSDLLQDFETYFTGKGLVTVVYRDTILDSSDDAVALYEYAGETGVAQVDGVLRSVQVVARSKSATTAKNKARELYASLITETGLVNLTAERWGAIHLRQPPFKMMVDEKDRTLYCFNLGIITYYD